MTKKKKVKLIMYGECWKCGRKIIRPSPADTAICICGNPFIVMVSLTPAIQLPARLYAKFEKLAELTGVELEALTNALLLEALKQKLKIMING